MGGTDTLINVDVVRGGAGNDTLTGGSLSRGATGTFFEIFRGNAGNDTINGNNAATDGDDASNDRADYANNTAAQAITVDMTAGTVQDGLGGTDTLIAIDQVSGGAGNDIFNASAAGGAGFDGGVGNDTFNGGAGRDAVHFQQSTAGAIVNLSAAAITVNAVTVAAHSASDGLGGTDSLNSIETIVGSDFDDFMRGSDDPAVVETFRGEGGNDTIDGGAGIDFVAFNGNALALGGITATISNGSGSINDGQGGVDTVTNIEGIIGTHSNDTLTGGIGTQWFRGDGGSDIIDGGADNDWASYANDPSGVTVNLATGIATDGFNGATGLLALGGTDTLISIENVEGSKYNDTITGSSADNQLTGGAGNDTLDGGAGADQLRGGDGNDTLTIDSSDTVVDGGNGIDTVNLTGNGMTFNLAFSNIEIANGTGGNDQIDGSVGTTGPLTLNGNGGSDTLTGGSSGDTINGGDGDDSLFGNGGADTINGGPGIDFINSGDGDDTIHGDSENDTIFAGDGVDTIFGDAGNEYAFGGNGNDTMTGGTGTDYLIGDDNDPANTSVTGNDTLNGGDDNDTLIGGYGSDTLNGDAGDNALYGDFDDVNAGTGATPQPGSDDILNGGPGNDFMFGGGGDDTLNGGNGNNTLIGGTGNDRLVGGTGSDSYYGQSGTDTFVFLDNWGTDGVWDFNDGSEIFDLTAVTGLNTFSQLSITDQVSGALHYADVSFGGNHIFVVGVSASQLTQADFVL
jgi:Ca2+-binding RTX toxin-like protein